MSTLSICDIDSAEYFLQSLPTSIRCVVVAFLAKMRDQRVQRIFACFFQELHMPKVLHEPWAHSVIGFDEKPAGLGMCQLEISETTEHADLLAIVGSIHRGRHVASTGTPTA